MRLKKPGSNLIEMEMTPMIDMTFQLISFFMFVINFNNELVEERVKLPLAETARPVERAAVQPLFLNISKDGRLLVLSQELRVQDPSDMAKINQYLRREAAYIKFDMQQAGKDVARGLEATAVIRADELTPYGLVQDIIRACREAGFVKFSLRALLEPR